MEKSSDVAVVPCDIGRSDIGSWTAIGNRIEGEALLHDVSNCYIQNRERMVGAVGVENLAIIDTPDVLLVAARFRAQDVKHIYVKLKTSGQEAHQLHRNVHRLWEPTPCWKTDRVSRSSGSK